MTHVIRRTIGALGICLLAAAGCAGPSLVPTPTLYTQSNDNPYEAVPAALRSNVAHFIYATDRAVTSLPDAPLAYGSGRSTSLAFGLGEITMGRDCSWEELVAASRSDRRASPIPLALTRIDERGRYPGLAPMIETEGGWIEDRAHLQSIEDANEQLQALLRERLSLSQRKHAFVFIHGYNNTFEDAAFRIAQIWHFLGREGVPIAYSWPAASGGLLRGYTQDRESGEFTIPHLKSFMRALAACSELEQIHYVAHSRGTDVLWTALRELHIENLAAGRSTRDALKLGQVVLAAPDMDLDVFLQRTAAERQAFVASHTTLYASPDDRAIGLADWLFRSFARLGRVKASDLAPEVAVFAERHPFITIVDVHASTGFTGHGYFTSNPAVLSDLILVLRDQRLPGAEHGRALIDRDSGFWELHDGYPNSMREP